LIARDLQGTYLPGQISSFDSIIGKEETIAAMVVEARFGSDTRGTILERYHVALRDDDELMPVGWVGSGLKMVEKKALSDRLMTLALHQNPEGAKVRPRVSLALKIAGARRIKDGYRLLRPTIIDVNLDAAMEDVDEIGILAKV
jgi:ATP-dependent DNA ligase